MDTNNLIVKKVLHAGTKYIELVQGCKVFFHFETRLCDADRKLIDDSRKMGHGKPMELVLGKKFKLEVWEAVVQKMAVNEVAVFTIDKSLVLQYPFVSKTLREASRPPEAQRKHCCAMTLQTEGIGYDDLNALIKSPGDLQFTIELLKVELPHEYKKETWQLNEDERLRLLPDLKETGNKKFHEGNYKDASDAYAEALGILEQLMLKEKPHENEWDDLDRQKLPFLLNYSQCKLNEGDFYGVIEHCTSALKTDPNNVKALFRRAKAHVGAWNPEDAKRDFERVSELDGSLAVTVKKELRKLEQLQKLKDGDDKAKLKHLF